MIRVLSVIGHGKNLIPHFVKYYTPLVDEINLVVYQSDIEPNLIEEVRDIVEKYPNVKIVKTLTDRIFDWEKVTQLYNFVKSEYPNDWWVIADIDEFHLYPTSLEKLILDCEMNGWDLVRGGFIDRIGKDGEFVELDKKKDIFKQFPLTGFFRYPLSKACPNKVCVVKGHVEITSGQHYAKIDGYTTWKWQGWNHPLIAPYQTHSVQVHHFKWDSTCGDRIKAVADIKQSYAYSDEYKMMYDKLRKSRFKIDITKPEFMFEDSEGRVDFNQYRQWNKLINKIVSI